jgi:hypothetical protein
VGDVELLAELRAAEGPAAALAAVREAQTRLER